MGEICAECRGEIERRARKISRVVAGTTTFLLAIYIYIRMPDDSTTRLVGITCTVAWYMLTGLVTRRILREALK